MTITDLFKNGNVFESMKNLNMIDFLKTADVEQVNNLFLLSYGMYNVSNGYENLTVDQIAKIICVALYDVWNKKYKEWTELQFPNTRDRQVTYTENNTGENTNNRTNTTTNKSGGYNSNELADTTQDDTTENTTNNSKNDKNYTLTEKIYNPDLFNNLEQYNKYLQENFLYSTIYRDIIRLVCTYIY